MGLGQGLALGQGLRQELEQALEREQEQEQEPRRLAQVQAPGLKPPEQRGERVQEDRAGEGEGIRGWGSGGQLGLALPVREEHQRDRLKRNHLELKQLELYRSFELCLLAVTGAFQDIRHRPFVGDPTQSAAWRHCSNS